MPAVITRGSSSRGARQGFNYRINTGIFRPDLTLPQSGIVVLAWMGLLMLPQAPGGNRYSAALVLSFLLVALASRNIAMITAMVLLFNVFCRFMFPISSWHDQHWTQWYSISSLLTGHNIFLSSPLVGMSMAAYMPMGDLFGGLFIALGIQEYWKVWHVVVPLLLALPVALAPSLTTLLIFICTSCFYPFCDYTTAGGTLEIAFAVTIAAIALYRSGQITPSLVFFAFAAMFRQPSVMLIPFVFILLWKARNFRRAGLFAALLFLFGGFYILIDLRGAYEYLFHFYGVFQQTFYNALQGLNHNYSISSLPHVFGVSDDVAWTRWAPIYLPLTLLSVGILVWIACRRKSSDDVLFLAVLATVFVYVFARGYAQYHYVLAAAFPMIALVYPAATRVRPFARFWSLGACLFLLWVGLTPLVLFVAARALNGIHGMGNTSQLITVARILELSPSGTAIEIPNLNGFPSHRHIFPVANTAQFDFAQPVFLSRLRLSGERVGIMTVKGMPILWATETEMRGIVTSGDIEYSADGKTFLTLEHFGNPVSYSVYPVTLMLRPTSEAVRAVRLQPRALYLDHREWVLGEVEFFGRRP